MNKNIAPHNPITDFHGRLGTFNVPLFGRTSPQTQMQQFFIGETDDDAAAEHADAVKAIGVSFAQPKFDKVAVTVYLQCRKIHPVVVSDFIRSYLLESESNVFAFSAILPKFMESRLREPVNCHNDAEILISAKVNASILQSLTVVSKGAVLKMEEDSRDATNPKFNLEHHVLALEFCLDLTDPTVLSSAIDKSVWEDLLKANDPHLTKIKQKAV